ncbi:MAG: hypothetical protein Q8908_00575 [Bacteroidota bacterium]|nr:hypothetical protein [Bacteroidota bacterium]
MLHKICLFFLLLISLSGYATHLRSGEISYTPVAGQPNTYLITFTIFTNAAPGITADVNTLPVSLGDGTNLTLTRQNGPQGYVGKNLCAHTGELITPIIRKNIFTTTHTYAPNKSYIISTAPTNRNLGITNFTGAGGSNYPMFINAMLTVGNGVTQMSSPVLQFDPIGDGCVNSIYKINPGAVDPDNDLLTFQLVRCETTNGADIPGYKYPNELDATGNTTFTMDPRTGIIFWKRPTIQGEYNIAFKIMKWRNGVMIGYILRDMQVTVAPCANNPPVIDPVPDLCIKPGTTINYKITSSDADGDTLTFSTRGLPYDVAASPATYTPEGTNIGSTTGTFNWNTNAFHYSKNPYMVYYKVTDSHLGSSLSDEATNFITLVAPAVKNVNATVNKEGFNVKWDQTESQQAIGYNIYRKIGLSNIPFDSCMLGLPAGTGFKLVGTVNGLNTLSYYDSNNGQGLTSGYSYCYVVTAVFNGGAESAPSQPSCGLLMYPYIDVLQDTVTRCLGNTITLDTTIVRYINADQNTTYSWSSTPEIRVKNASKSNPDIVLNKVGIYPVKIVSVSGAYTDSAKIYIKIDPLPEPNIKRRDMGGMPDSVMFYNSSRYSVRAEWLLPDGFRSSNMDSVMFVFNSNGYYRIYLTVYNSFGCPDTTSILYRVVMKGVAMPNAFEPENPNSELNIFRPAALGLQTYYLGIWDLWGNLVWSSNKVANTQPAEGWNGNDIKGQKMPAQNYIWRMKATFIDGTQWKGIKDHFGKFHKEGTFSLLR